MSDALKAALYFLICAVEVVFFVVIGLTVWSIIAIMAVQLAVVGVPYRRRRSGA